MIITIGLVSTQHHTGTIFSCDENFSDLLSFKQLSNIQKVLLTVVTRLCITHPEFIGYNWELVPFDHLLSFLPPANPNLW